MTFCWLETTDEYYKKLEGCVENIGTATLPAVPGLTVASTALFLEGLNAT